MTYLNAVTRTYGYRLQDRAPVTEAQSSRHHDFIPVAEYLRDMTLTASLSYLAAHHTLDCPMWATQRSLDDLLLGFTNRRAFMKMTHGKNGRQELPVLLDK
jgi:hypothetical protein